MGDIIVPFIIADQVANLLLTIGDIVGNLEALPPLGELQLPVLFGTGELLEMIVRPDVGDNQFRVGHKMCIPASELHAPFLNHRDLAVISDGVRAFEIEQAIVKINIAKAQRRYVRAELRGFEFVRTACRAKKQQCRQ